MIKRYLKRALLSLGLVGVAFGAFAGSATATGERSLCWWASGAPVVYSSTYHTYDAYAPCDTSVGSLFWPTASAYTIRGTHSDSNVQWFARFYGQNNVYLGASPTHQSLGLNWGPGVNPFAGTISFDYVIVSTTRTDAFYVHN